MGTELQVRPFVIEGELVPDRSHRLPTAIFAAAGCTGTAALGALLAAGEPAAAWGVAPTVGLLVAGAVAVIRPRWST